MTIHPLCPYTTKLHSCSTHHALGIHVPVIVCLDDDRLFRVPNAHFHLVDEPSADKLGVSDPRKLIFAIVAPVALSISKVERFTMDRRWARTGFKVEFCQAYACFGDYLTDRRM